MATIRIDGSKFQAAIKKFAEFEGRNVVTVARQQFRLLNKRLMDWTPPMDGKQPGTGLADKKAGQRQVARDIGRVFAGMNVDAVRRWKKRLPHASTKDGMPLFSLTASPELHEQKRGSHGRVRRDSRGEVKVTYRGRNISFKNAVHAPRAAIKKYIKLKQKNVGKAKGGWASGGALWGHGVPGWVSTHSGQGTARDRLKPNGNGYLITSNRSAGAGNRGTNILNKAVASRIRDIEAKMLMAMKAGWKQAGGK
jgi:hypothetical protein